MKTWHFLLTLVRNLINLVVVYYDLPEYLTYLIHIVWILIEEIQCKRVHKDMSWLDVFIYTVGLIVVSFGVLTLLLYLVDVIKNHILDIQHYSKYRFLVTVLEDYKKAVAGKYPGVELVLKEILKGMNNGGFYETSNNLIDKLEMLDESQ